MDPIRYISAIVLVGILLAGAVWLLRRFNLANLGVKPSLSVLSHLNVGTREKLIVVRFANEDVLLGVTPHSITRLGAAPAGQGHIESAETRAQPGRST